MTERKVISWSNTDPRKSCLRGILDIIIMRPRLETDTMDNRIYSAKVYVYEDMYSIYTTFTDHPVVKKDEQWDSSWLWIEDLKI